MSKIFETVKNKLSSDTDSSEQQFGVNPITDADQSTNAPRQQPTQEWTPGLGSSGNISQAYDAQPGLANVDAAGQQPILSKEEQDQASFNLNN